MVNYQNGKIYKVTNTENDIIYIGSTTRALWDRMGGHRFYAKVKSTPFLKAMRDVGVANFSIHLIKKYPCEEKEELEAEEFRIMKKYKSRGVELYNEFIGTHSQATKERMSGEHHHAFKRGSLIHRDKFTKSVKSLHWMFKWCIKGKQFTKSFSYARWGGERGARRMAECWQKKIFPLKKND